MRDFFEERIQNHYHVIWKIIYLTAKYWHYLVLLFLFLNGKEINKLRNLGFISFFTVYTASEWLYRETSVLLNVFISFFIFGQYYFSLTYYRYDGNTQVMDLLLYINMYEDGKIYQWESDTNIYWRHIPYPNDFAILIIMGLLRGVNNLYNQGTESEVMYENAERNFMNKYTTVYKYWMAFSSYFSILIFGASIGLAFYLFTIVQTNLISWIFFIQFSLIFTDIIKMDTSQESMKITLRKINWLKYISVFILFCDIVFVVVFGDKASSSTAADESYDAYLKVNNPRIYWSLSMIGLRMQEPIHEYTGTELH